MILSFYAGIEPKNIFVIIEYFNLFQLEKDEILDNVEPIYYLSIEY